MLPSDTQSAGQNGIADSVGVRQVIARGREGSPDCQQSVRMQMQRIAQIVERNTVGNLGVEQAGDMAMRRKASALRGNPRLPGQRRDKTRWNEVADLP